jgi:hypothetical protein
MGLEGGCRAMYVSVGRSVRRSSGRSVSQALGRSVGRSGGQAVTVRRSGGRSIGRSVCQVGDSGGLKRCRSVWGHFGNLSSVAILALAAVSERSVVSV